jgi:hypothetical protein
MRASEAVTAALEACELGHGASVRVICIQPYIKEREREV